jgi:hypothetical protein
MLAENTYPHDYVRACQAQIAAQLAAYKALKLDAAAAAKFGPPFFNNLVLALDRMFVHRTRAREGKDGNPLNEVRMLCDGILEHGGVLRENKTIKYDPAKAVLKLPLGSAIAVTAEGFAKLQQAYFAEIAAKFM